MKPTEPSTTDSKIEDERGKTERAERNLQRALAARPSSTAPKSARREMQRTQRADPRKK